MNEKEYRDMFSQLHSSVQEEAITMKTKPTKRVRFVSVPVAAVLVLVLTAGIAFAGVYSNRIQDITVLDNEGYECMSLQGFADSPEYKATQEWLTFEEKYEKEHKAELDAIGNDPTPWDDKYGDYFVFTQEMADKVDEICGKYNLKLHSGSEPADAKDIYKKFGKFSSNKEGSGYYYKDGTFSLDDDASVDGRSIPYQFRRTMKGVFDTVYLNIGDTNKYEQWEYETANGVTVLLALSDFKGLILCDYNECFVAVNVLGGTKEAFTDEGDTVTKKSMEALADSFDFSVLGTYKKPANSDAEEPAEAVKEETDEATDEQLTVDPPADSEFKFECNPIDDPDAVITKRFGNVSGREHEGIDFASDEGTAIHAVADGSSKVYEADADYGNYVIIDHNNGWCTVYAHCETILVEDGASVKAGDEIATVGSTGTSSGPHLHFELRGNPFGPVDPEPYLAK